MEDLNVVDSINHAGTWLARNQELLLSYAVNIVAAIAILIVGMIVARVVSNTVNRLMLARKIDATVAVKTVRFWLSSCGQAIGMVV